MWIVLICAGAGLAGAVGYAYVPTERIQSPALATAINYGTPLVIGAALGLVALAVS